MNTLADNKPLLVHFKGDTANTISRDTTQEMAKKLGLSETALVHLALAQMRGRMLGESALKKAGTLQETQEPLSDEAMSAIHAAGKKAVDAMEAESPVANKESLF